MFFKILFQSQKGDEMKDKVEAICDKIFLVILMSLLIILFVLLQVLVTEVTEDENSLGCSILIILTWSCIYAGLIDVALHSIQEIKDIKKEIEEAREEEEE